MGDTTFFTKDVQGNLRCLPGDAPPDLIASANDSTIKLDNQKKGWTGICVYQQANEDPINCPVRVMGHCYIHLQQHGATKKTIILVYYSGRKRFDVTSYHISKAFKLAAVALEYPILKRNPHKTN